MYLTHAILHKTAEGPKPKKLDPRVQSWLDKRTKSGGKQYMGGDSILEMIKADSQAKKLNKNISSLMNISRDKSKPREVRLAAQQKAFKLRKQMEPLQSTVDTFNRRRALRKEHGITPEFYQQERAHEKRAVKSASDAFMNTLREAGYGKGSFESIPPEVRAKAEAAARTAGEEYVKGRLGFLSDKEAADIQRYGRYQAARRAQGMKPSAFQYDDPEYQQQLGQMALSHGASQKISDSLAKGVAGAGEDALAALRSDTPMSSLTPESAYDEFIDRTRNTYADATKNMQQRYSDERTAKIKKWAPWVIGGGALLTGMLAGFGGGKEEKPVDPWQAAKDNPDKMAWTKDAFRSAARNPQGPLPGQAPKNPFSGAFKNFMSKNPFGRA